MSNIQVQQNNLVVLSNTFVPSPGSATSQVLFNGNDDPALARVMALLQGDSFDAETGVNKKQKLITDFQNKVQANGGFVGTLIGGKNGILEALQQLDPQAS